MRVLVCCTGGLGEAVAILPTLEALTDGLDDPVITVLCAPRLAGFIATSIPGVRPIAITPETLGGLGRALRVPALVKQIGPVDVALMAPHQSRAVSMLARRVSPKVVGFACGSSAGQRDLNIVLPYHEDRPVPDVLCDFARLLLDWPTMPLQRVAPLRQSLDPFSVDLFALEAGEDAGDWQGDGWDDPGTDSYGVIHSGAGSLLQRWGEQSFHDLAGRLTALYGFPWRLVDEGDYDLVDLTALLAGAHGFVGCHSGPLQLAAAQGVPWVAVAGPTPVAWDPPWRDVPGEVLRRGLECQPCGHVGQALSPCLHDAVCLAALSVEDVVQSVTRVIPLPRQLAAQ